MTTTDRRVVKTLARIHDAFIGMLVEMDYDRITISELTKRANVDRKTFYLHFRDKDDLMSEFQAAHCERLIQYYREARGDRTGPDSLDAIAASIKAEFQNVQTLHRHIAKTPSYNFLLYRELDSICDTISQEFPSSSPGSPTPSDPQMSLRRKYYVGGILNIYWAWLRENEPISIDEMLEIALDAVSHGLNGLYVQKTAETAGM